MGNFYSLYSCSLLIRHLCCWVSSLNNLLFFYFQNFCLVILDLYLYIVFTEIFLVLWRPCFCFKCISNVFLLIEILQWRMLTQSLSHVWLFVTPWMIACQASLSMEFSRQGYWSGLLFSIPGVFLTQRLNPHASPAMMGRFFTTVSPGKPRSLLPVCNFS